MSTSSTDTPRFAVYQPIPATATFHSVPRFGHTNNFAVLFANNQQEQSDYIRGIIFSGVLILSFFLVWFLLILMFKCVGPRRVGFLAGTRIQVQPHEEEEDDDDKDAGGTTTPPPMETNRLNKKSSSSWQWSRPNVIRFTFFISTVIVITFAALLVTKGLTKIETTANSLGYANFQIYDIITGFQGVGRNLEQISIDANLTRARLTQQLINFCANTTTTTLPPSASPIIDNVRSSGDEAIQVLNGLGDFYHTQLQSAQQSLSVMEQSSQDFNEALSKINYQAVAVAVGIIYIVIPTFFLLGVLSVWFGYSSLVAQCCLTWCILPLWIIFVILAIVCGAMASWAVIANSDFCSGGTQATPDATIEAFLIERNVDPNSFEGHVINFYQSKCHTVNPWDFLQTFETNLTAVNDTLTHVSDNLASLSAAGYDAICNKDFSQIATVLNNMQGDIGLLFVSLVTGLQLLACTRIVPIYTQIFYSTTCVYSITALTWSMAGFLVISFFGMIMITFRSAWTDVMYFNRNDSQAKDAYHEEGIPPPDYYDDYDIQNPPLNEFGAATAPVEEEEEYHNHGRYDDNDHHEDEYVVENVVERAQQRENYQPQNNHEYSTTNRIDDVEPFIHQENAKMF